MLEEGLSHDLDADDSMFTSDQMELFDIFQRFLTYSPLIADFLEAENTDLLAFARDIETGKKRGRNEDVDTFKNNIDQWHEGFKDHPFPRGNRRLAGFKHPECGRLLCPAERDWTDADVQQDLLDNDVKPGDFPSVLYANEIHDPNNPFHNFLKNDNLVKGYKAIYRGPKFALGGDSGPACIASIYNISYVSIHSIAYVAVLLRFVLSDQDKFHAGGSGGKWPYRLFYNEIINVVTFMTEDQRQDLLEWWDEQIFSDFQSLSHDSSDNDEDSTPSLASKMRAHAVAIRDASLSSAAPSETAPSETAGSGSDD